MFYLSNHGDPAVFTAIIIKKFFGGFTMAQAQAQATKKQETANLGDSLFNNWTSNLDKVYTARKEVEELFFQVFETQKETWEKITGDITRIEAEQKKLIEELRETVKQNIHKVFGPAVSQAFEQFNAQFDEVANRIQELSTTPYKEGLQFINQTQEQFQQSLKNGIEKQQKIQGDVAEQIKSTQQMFIDLYETNSRVALGFFK